MKLSDFDFQLPQELIAQYPLAERRDSRLLHLPADDGVPRDLRFKELPGLLRPGDLLVMNDTRVMRARLFGRKASGGRVEILIERLVDHRNVLAQLRASKSPKPNSLLLLEDGEEIVVKGRSGEFFQLHAADFPDLMERYGHMPLPPYIERGDEAADESRYQTVYARREGAVAAPTAGLHFDLEMLDLLKEQGVEQAHVTLHVGAGTFQPVRGEDLDRHVMHSEYLEVSQEVCDQVARARERGGRIVAVGTTSVRSLESAAADGVLRPYYGDTRLFIRPGYRFRVVDLLITNFHLPKSTLLMLVSAFAGYRRVRDAYSHAVEQGYRFFSYGDAMLLERNDAASSGNAGTGK
jgi:S-adenosylmethionine:tRNA ribosyltransferase-isomerase